MQKACCPEMCVVSAGKSARIKHENQANKGMDLLCMCVLAGLKPSFRFSVLLGELRCSA